MAPWFPIRCEGLTKRFGSRSALSGVTFSVPEGAIYALIGANGSGKSTLMRVALNIHRASSGWSELLGKRSGDLRYGDFRHIGYVAEGQNSADWLTVAEYEAFLSPFYPGWNSTRFHALRRQLRVPNDKRINQMSRGTRMKALLIAALAYRPKALLLDEPLGGLDPLARDEIGGVLRDEASGCTILISSHDLFEMESLATHIGYLEDGQLRFSEPTSDLQLRFRRVVTEGESRIMSDYRGDESEQLLAERFGSRMFRTESMNLREIFITLAREAVQEDFE